MSNSYLIIYTNQKDLRSLRKFALYSSIYQQCDFFDNKSHIDYEQYKVLIYMTHDLLSLVKIKCKYKKNKHCHLILADGEDISILKTLNEENFIIIDSDCRVSEFRENLLYLNPKQKDEINITRREKEILSLILKGQNNYKIANQLGISERTIEAHKRNIYMKIGVHSITQLTLWAVNNKLIK